MAPTESNNSLLTQLNTAIIRLDSKVDHILEALKDLRAGHLDHETRLRVIEAAYATKGQVKEVADKPTVSPGTMWKVAGLALTVTSILWGVLVFVINILR